MDIKELHVLPHLGPWWREIYARISTNKKRRFFSDIVDRADTSNLSEKYRYTVLELNERLDSTGEVDGVLWDILIKITKQQAEMLKRDQRPVWVPDMGCDPIHPEVTEALGFYNHQRQAAYIHSIAWAKLLDLLISTLNADERRKIVVQLMNL